MPFTEIELKYVENIVGRMCRKRSYNNNGFEIVGTLPGAFHHPTLGYVDALVMYKQLLPNRVKCHG